MLNIRAAKKTIRIAELVNSIQMVYPHGVNHSCRCLFHEERTASMTLYRNTQRYYCFGCGVKGDLIDLAKHIFECDTTTALQQLSAWSSRGKQMSKGFTTREAVVTPDVSAAYRSGYNKGKADAARRYNLEAKESSSNPTLNGHDCRLFKSVNHELELPAYCEDDCQHNSMIENDHYQLSLLFHQETQDFLFGLSDDEL